MDNGMHPLVISPIWLILLMLQIFNCFSCLLFLAFTLISHLWGWNEIHVRECADSLVNFMVLHNCWEKYNSMPYSNRSRWLGDQILLINNVVESTLIYLKWCFATALYGYIGIGFIVLFMVSERYFYGKFLTLSINNHRWSLKPRLVGVGYKNTLYLFSCIPAHFIRYTWARR